MSTPRRAPPAASRAGLAPAPAPPAPPLVAPAESTPASPRAAHAGQRQERKPAAARHRIGEGGAIAPPGHGPLRDGVSDAVLQRERRARGERPVLARRAQVLVDRGGDRVDDTARGLEAIGER